MREINHQELCKYYYELSLKVNPSHEDEKRLSEILDLVVDDIELSYKIADIDAEIFDKNPSLVELTNEEIISDLSRIKDLIDSYSLSDGFDDSNENLDACIKLSADNSAHKIVTEYILTIVSHDNPRITLSAFQKIFVEAGKSFNDSRVVDAVQEILNLNDFFNSFFSTLHNCLYIPIDRWLMKPDYHLSIVKLIDLFDQRTILEKANEIHPKTLEALLEFTQTDEFFDLLRLTNFIRYRVYNSSSNLVWRDQEP